MRRRHRLVNRAVHAALGWVDRAGEVVPGTALADRFGSFGVGSCIDFPPATLQNVESIHLGRGVLVGRHATLAAGYGVGDPNLSDRALVIGDGCVVGARTTITAHTYVELGDSVFTGQSVFITDASHGYQDPETPIGKQFGLHQPVTIGSGTWIGHGAVILPGARIGRNVVVAAGAVVRGEVEDHAVVAGTPARVVRRLQPGVGWVGTSGDVRPLFGQRILEGLEGLG
ncbi:MAG TPA: DapH/DapD/GlmU-related protein [Nocardioides sp.]|nr:DapH/DapD/GlmU-related protein [Nocardioides sp.]